MTNAAKDLFQYRGCGLDWVFLENGYTIHKTPYGEGVSISDADGLHAVLLREIITSTHPIRGQELRFIRSMLDLSQEGMGKIMGVRRLQITRMEGRRDKPVTPSADRAIRMFFALHEFKKDLADRVLELLNEIDNLSHEVMSFSPTDRGWARAA